MSRGYLHSFATLRTRLPVPPEIDEPEPRRCYYCRAKLRSGNLTTTCSPCAGAGFPEMLELEPVDPDAPECACGCGERTLRALQSHGGKQLRTGPYQRFVGHHNNNLYRRREVTQIETPE